jgi:hypothetical protein
VNWDGRPDIITARGVSTVSVALGAGDGTVGGASAFSSGVGTTPVFITTADMNHDGKPDLVTVNANGPSGSISVLLNGP